MKRLRRVAHYPCQRGCGRLVTAGELVCVACLTRDARTLARDARVFTPQDVQKGVAGAEDYKAIAKRKATDLEKVLKVIVSRLAGTPGFAADVRPVAQALDEAGERSAAFRAWLTGKGVARSEGGWGCSTSAGRSARSSATGTG